MLVVSGAATAPIKTASRVSASGTTAAWHARCFVGLDEGRVDVMSYRMFLGLLSALPLCACASSRSPACAKEARAIEAPPVTLTGAKLATREGKITGFTTMPNGDMNGVVLDDGSHIRFPSYTGRALLPLVRPHDRIRVSGWEITGPEGTMVEATKIVSKQSGKAVDIGALPVPPADLH
jgi:hypothetical protein